MSLKDKVLSTLLWLFEGGTLKIITVIIIMLAVYHYLGFELAIIMAVLIIISELVDIRKAICG